MKTSWQIATNHGFVFEFGGGSSAPPVYMPPAPTPPDPYTTANAQQGYNVNSQIAQALLNNTTQNTPYGQISYQQTGGQTVGATPGSPGTPATGGFWNGQSWTPTGGTKAQPAFEGTFVPQYSATTTLSPQVQQIVNQNLDNSFRSGELDKTLSQNAFNTLSKPLDLSWGNLQSNIFGLERNSLDPYWAQQQQVKDQSLANQGLTPGSQGWGFEQTQFGLNKANAYNQAMLGAQGQAAQDIIAQYTSPLNALTALRSNSQISQPGVGQLAPTNQSQVQSAPYANVATSNYAVGSQALTAAEGLQQQQYQNQQQQQNQLLGGLFGLGGSLIGGLGGLVSDRRLKTDIKEIGHDHATGLPLYAYRYKGDPKSYPKAVGPMAQDIEKVAPEAVGEIEGHKIIDVGKVAEHWGIGG